MQALQLVDTWPVEHFGAAVVTDRGIEIHGDAERTFQLTSLSKPMTAWAIMIGVEEGIVELDAPLRHVVAPEGCTLRHLLAHAGGFGFDGDAPIAPIERKRMYSNTGIERAADELAASADMPFADYLRLAVFEPLDMDATDLFGSPAYSARSTLGDTVRFVSEMRAPKLIAASTYNEVTVPQYPELSGIVPDVGRFDPCPWGLGVEVLGDKSPHWTGRANSPATFGHFGGSGTMMWVDPVAHVGTVALTDRAFDQWRDDALRLWPEFSDAVLVEAGATS